MFQHPSAFFKRNDSRVSGLIWDLNLELNGLSVENMPEETLLLAIYRNAHVDGKRVRSVCEAT